MVSMLFIAALTLSEPGREIALERVVPGTPQEVSALWTSPEGVRTFFAPAAVIEPRAGGEYTIIFEPERDPQGLSFGTKGARILAFEPGRRLVFEWITFTTEGLEGMPGGPPAIPAAERNVSPLPTAVELTFEAAGATHTRVRLVHRGFRRGGKWDESYQFFERAWAGVLEGLARR
jgi:uncharacterized protein YndB with AHSA1/START domain